MMRDDGLFTGQTLSLPRRAAINNAETPGAFSITLQR